MNDLGELIVRVAREDNLRRATGVFLCDGVVCCLVHTGVVVHESELVPHRVLFLSV
jgi:hypothetical protein